MNRKGDDRYYKSLERHQKRQDRALAKIANRGRVGEEWLKANKLTSATKPAFDQVIRQADKQWERDNPK